MEFRPKKIYIDNRAKKYGLTTKICKYFSNIPTEIIKDSNSFIKNFYKSKNAISKGKEFLFLTINKGKFLKKCPGTKNYLCCGYQILHQASQCSLDCSYCILQSYFNNPLISIYVNLDEMMEELDKRLNTNPDRLFRIGTGEFTDSLVFDHITGFSKTIIPYFKKQKNAILELKTKTVNINNMLKFNPKGKVIAAWSMNSSKIRNNEELFSATIEERLKAAQKCEKAGFKLAFHFDPIIYYKGWEKDYQKTVKLIFKYVSASSIAWISMGSFRFIPSLKNIITSRFPNSNFIYNEFIIGLDGKMRYIKPIRVKLYKQIYKWIKIEASNVFVYLCMESAEVWKESFGYTPRKFGSLIKGLDKCVF